jgi:thiol-disulfide isomerase/thioredoxin
MVFCLHGRTLPATILYCLVLLLPWSATAAAEVDCEPRNVNGTVISVHCGDTPSAHFDDTGTLWVVFEQNGHAWVSRSRNAGGSFDTPVRVNAEPEVIETNGENRPKILVDSSRNTVYVSWTQKTEGQFTGDIRFSRSTDGGRQFEPPRTVNDDGLLTSHRFESLHLTDSGHLYVTWLDKRDLEAARAAGGAYRGSAVYYTVSADQGAGFAPNRKVADHSCECCRIATAPHGEDGVALLWRHVFEGSVRDHAVAVIDPGGVVSEPARATDDEWRIEACPHHGPALAAPEDGGQDYHMAWFSNGERHQGIHYGRHDLETARTVAVHEVDGRPGAGHPQLMVHQGTIHLVWKHFDGLLTRLLVIRSSDGGDSWSEPVTMLETENSSDHPLLLEGPDGPVAAWWTRVEGFRMARLADNDHTEHAVAGDASGDEAAAAPRNSTDTGADIHPFVAETLAEIQQEYAGRPFLLALWSVDCPPCMAELSMLGRLRKEHPDLPLVLVSTDPVEQRDDAEDFLLDYQLTDMRSWMFADPFAERLRFTIDPQWYGELPRSYYYDASHQPEAHSGMLTEAQVREWLDL